MVKEAWIGFLPCVVPQLVCSESQLIQAGRKHKRLQSSVSATVSCGPQCSLRIMCHTCRHGEIKDGALPQSLTLQLRKQRRKQVRTSLQFSDVLGEIEQFLPFKEVREGLTKIVTLDLRGLKGCILRKGSVSCVRSREPRGHQREGVADREARQSGPCGFCGPQALLPQKKNIKNYVLPLHWYKMNIIQADCVHFTYDFKRHENNFVDLRPI